MGRRIGYFVIIAVLLLTTFFLVTCNNKFDIFNSIQTEVKIANDKFLILKDFSPQNNTPDVNPGLTITLDFDRLLDEDAINSTSIVFDPPVAWNHSFNTSNKTLSIYPFPYLEGGIEYTITVTKGLKGADGSDVQEEIAWSFTTDTLPAGGIQLSGGDAYTSSATVDLEVTGNNESQYVIYSFNEDFLPGTTTRVTLTQSPQIIPNVELLPSGTEGFKTIYAKFEDADNFVNDIGIAHDTIGLDLNPPTIDYFRINNNQSATSSTRVGLDSSVSDFSPLEMRFYNTGYGWSSWQAYSSSTSWTLASSVGTRTVNAQYRDAVGHTTSEISDSIIYGAPTVTSATLNSTTVGDVTVGWTSASADTGTNSYYVYWREYPSGTNYLGGYGTTGSSRSVPAQEGILYYFHVRIYNSAAGWGNFSTSSKLGYTSDVAIIYDSNSSIDTTIANDMKTILTTNIPGTYSSVGGTMPSWSVTLVPQILVSTTYSAANVFYGYPVIITPGNDLYSNANQSRNVVAHGHGVFAMGTGGTRLLDTCETYWGSWSLSGTAPTEIGWGESAIASAGPFMYTWTSGNSVWSYPLNSTTFPGGTSPTNNARTQISYADISRVSVYRGSDTNPTDGWLYGKEDSATSHYYPVVRQGRCLQFGFQQETDRPYTGWVYITNLVYRMSAVYY